jgi:glutathione synthase/RimK-type ligase-like ATP-grasp enzyme
MKNFLFISGESTISLPLVYSTKEWNHTTNSGMIVYDKCLHRKVFPFEDLHGVIFYSDYDDKSLQYFNLLSILESKVICWPDPVSLIAMRDRHRVLKECVDAGFVNHHVDQVLYFRTSLDFPVVVKTGNSHRGQDKFLVKSCRDIPQWQGVATIEPFFEGKSVRVLVINNDYDSFEVINDSSWIKNTEGADILPFEASKELVEHAFAVTKHFKLDIAGVDYIVNDDGFHFLEINQFPGLGVTDKAEKLARTFLASKLDEIVKNARTSIE